MKRVFYMLVLSLVAAAAAGIDLNATDDDAVDLDEHPQTCNYPTPYHSCLSNAGTDGSFTDAIILGRWRLRVQKMMFGGHVKISEFHGHIVTFRNDGTYTEEYYGETSGPKTIYTPQGSMTTECKGTGSVYGRYNLVQTMDPTVPGATTELRITKLGGSQLKVVCENSFGATVSSKLPATMPLHMGAATAGGMHGHYVKIEYAISYPSWSTMTTTVTMPTGVKLVRIYDFMGTR